MKEFRLVYSPLRDSFYNTAIDHVLAERMGQGLCPDTIVISEWSPTVSISRHQRMDLDVDVRACDRNGVTAVRRYGAGKSVYLDQDYLVISLIAQYPQPGTAVADLRTKHCESIISALKTYDVPVLFHQPDNIVVAPRGQYRTLGNAGQRGFDNRLYLQSAIRCALSEQGMQNIIDTLRVNGEGLHDHVDDARNALAALSDYLPGPISKQAMGYAVAEALAASFNGVIAQEENHFTAEEHNAIGSYAEHHTSASQWLNDKPEYRSLGICYFFLNGVNLLPRMRASHSAASTSRDLFQQ